MTLPARVRTRAPHSGPLTCAKVILLCLLSKCCCSCTLLVAFTSCLQMAQAIFGAPPLRSAMPAAPPPPGRSALAALRSRDMADLIALPFPISAFCLEVCDRVSGIKG